MVTVAAGDVTARPIEAGDEPVLDRIRADLEHDRYGRGRRLCCDRRIDRAGDDDGHTPAHEVGRQCRQPVTVAVGPGVVDDDVSTLDEARFAQTLAERSHERPGAVRRSIPHEPDHRGRRLLRASAAAANQAKTRPPRRRGA